MSTSRPSELEHVVLGIVWKEGPCTPHAIRTNFVASRNTRFSGSAGAIYPLVARMERRGLLCSRADRRKRQRRRLYEVTAEGRARLRDWLAPPYTEDDLGVQHDPIRLRVYFLAALPPARRRAFLDTCTESLRSRLVELRDDLQSYADRQATYSVLAIQGALAVTRAQLRWLASIRKALDA
jgi:DNA-binding PadR family transcriptional regulator